MLLGQGVGFIEKWKKTDALYWSWITATTVGYGDISPKKKFSRFLSIIIALIGMMFTAIIIAVTLSSTSLALEKYMDASIVEKIKGI
jgi:voltage-gated potassium channel